MLRRQGAQKASPQDKWSLSRIRRFTPFALQTIINHSFGRSFCAGTDTAVYWTPETTLASKLATAAVSSWHSGYGTILRNKHLRSRQQDTERISDDRSRHIRWPPASISRCLNPGTRCPLPPHSTQRHQGVELALRMVFTVGLDPDTVEAYTNTRAACRRR